MVENIYELKNEILQIVRDELADKGPEHVDVEQMGMMVDMVKDLAESEKNCWKAEYYRSVSEAMKNTHSRRGYGDAGHGDSIEGVRNMLMVAGPEERERMKAELRSMLGM